jgi:hypothetical protein
VISFSIVVLVSIGLVETPFDSILSKVTNETVFVWHCSPEARGAATTADKSVYTSD